MNIVPARLTHVGQIASKMREADKRECRALGRTPKEALRLGLRMSHECLSAIDEEGRPVAMFGVVAESVLGGVGRPWLLGTDRIFMHVRELLFIGPRVIEAWRQQFPVMENIVAADNYKAIRLLKHWGFVVDSETELHRGVAFRRFKLQA